MHVEVPPMARVKQLVETMAVRYLKDSVITETYLGVKKVIVNSRVKSLQVHAVWGNDTLL
jgi:hypothetical protein